MILMLLKLPRGSQASVSRCKVRLLVSLFVLVLFTYGAKAVDISDLNTSQLDTLLKPDFSPGDNNKTTPEQIAQRKEQKQRYERAERAYRVGSYYEAVDNLVSLVKNPDSDYFIPALLLSGKIYLKIGSKTGIQKYLWTSIAYLNLYMGRVDKPEWEYFYIKGMVYENLDFPERAEVFYKKAIENATTKKETAKGLVGLMRIAVWKRKIDLPTKYLILENIQMLKTSAAVEYDFIRGMNQFLKKNYEKALVFFQRTYRNNEHYLIDNPDYYLLVAESAYRDEKYQLAEHFFRRIVAVVKSSDVMQKALMRMGDLAWRQGNMKSAANYYFLVARKFTGTDLATVAKLKLIFLSQKDPNITDKLIALDEEAFSDPDKYVTLSLAKNRTNFVGRYALANFGEMVLGLKTTRLDERLSWEISLIGTSRLDFEQKEYIEALWKPRILSLEPERICALYPANSTFFETVFDRAVLLHISKALSRCGSFNARLDLLRFIAKRWHTDEDLLQLSAFLFDEKKYADALEALHGIKVKVCEYAKLATKSEIMLSQNVSVEQGLLDRCGKDDVEALMLASYYALKQGDIDTAARFAKEHSDFLVDAFPKERVGHHFVKELILVLLHDKQYAKAQQILLPMTKTIKDNCFLNSMVLLSSIRTGNGEGVEAQAGRLRGCKTDWAAVALRVYESYSLGLRAEKR